jgi:CRISPR system Cascade subunit CasA
VHNYITDAWIDVRFADNSTALIRPDEVVCADNGQAPIDVTAPHQAIRIGVFEKLLGLFQSLWHPSRADIVTAWQSPPHGATIRAWLAPAAPFFYLFGTTPAFQDTSVANEPEESVSALLLTAPGEHTRKYNQDLWSRDYEALSVELAMQALVTAQTHSPAGGSGHRTSIRGGGPITTLVDADTLWHRILANLLPSDEFDRLGNGSRELPALFPWAPARTGRVTPEDAPASHLYFSCPRRILLSPPVEGVCALTGRTGWVVRSMRSKNKGPEYDSSLWRHPLTPYYRRKEKGIIQVLPRLGAALPFGCAWKEWVGLVADTGDAAGPGLAAAAIVRQWRSQPSLARRLGMARLSVEAFGLRCASANILGTVSGRLPVPELDDSVVSPLMDWSNGAVSAASEIADLLKSALQKAGSQSAADAALTRFWSETESDFYARQAAVAALLGAGETAASAAIADVSRSLHEGLVRTALRVFDDEAPIVSAGEPGLVVTARRDLSMFSRGKRVLVILGLQRPAAKTKRTSA